MYRRNVSVLAVHFSMLIYGYIALEKLAFAIRSKDPLFVGLQWKKEDTRNPKHIPKVDGQRSANGERFQVTWTIEYFGIGVKTR